ncbi:MAG: hypothetical protein CMI16_09870 [Opitutaceae bacterium]|nr:hypothetical protein [Opitutaceae bacterium]
MSTVLRSPIPKALDSFDAITCTLNDTGLKAADIDYVNAHATSTPAGDRSEAHAFRNTFTDVGATPRVSSTKGLTGHPLSMAGMMEAAFCALAIKEKLIPGNVHLQTPDEACDGLDLPRATLEEASQTVLTTSSGFGGSNDGLIFRQS